MKHIISLKEQSPEDILAILDLAQKIKAETLAGKRTDYLKNKVLIMLFEKTSTRTRLSFEAAMAHLGGQAIFLDTRTSQMALAEFVDEIRAVMQFGDALMYRAKQSKNVEIAAGFDIIPVIDACSEKYHPCQALADMLTMIEDAQGLENIKKIVWLGIENNVMNTLMLAATKLGIKFTIIAPDKDPDSIDLELNQMAESTGLVERTLDLESGLKDASYIHTDTWLNMEFFDNKEELAKRKTKFLPYQINANLVKNFCPQAKIMHCMPLHIGHEISRDAVEHPNSIIFKQAQNRLHLQKGLLCWLLT